MEGDVRGFFGERSLDTAGDKTFLGNLPASGTRRVETASESQRTEGGSVQREGDRGSNNVPRPSSSAGLWP